MPPTSVEIDAVLPRHRLEDEHRHRLLARGEHRHSGSVEQCHELLMRRVDPRTSGPGSRSRTRCASRIGPATTSSQPGASTRSQASCRTSIPLRWDDDAAEDHEVALLPGGTGRDGVGDQLHPVRAERSERSPRRTRRDSVITRSAPRSTHPVRRGCCVGELRERAAVQVGHRRDAAQSRDPHQRSLSHEGTARPRGARPARLSRRGSRSIAQAARPRTLASAARRSWGSPRDVMRATSTRENGHCQVAVDEPESCRRRCRPRGPPGGRSVGRRPWSAGHRRGFGRPRWAAVRHQNPPDVLTVPVQPGSGEEQALEHLGSPGG